MSLQRVLDYFKQFNIDDRVQVFDVSSATVALAAEALGCQPCRIAKTLSFDVGEKTILVVAAGDVKIDNNKYKRKFGCKAKMLKPDDAEAKIGHAVGGICPFGVNQGVEVYLDQSLRRFASVFPACGSSKSAIELTIDELEKYSNSLGWIDVCKNL